MSFISSLLEHCKVSCYIFVISQNFHDPRPYVKQNKSYSNMNIAELSTLLIYLFSGMVEEVASSSSVDSNQPRVPRLILLLISLTGTALLVLNISIIVCFVRRRAIRRNISGNPELPYKNRAIFGDYLSSSIV